MTKRGRESMQWILCWERVLLICFIYIYISNWCLCLGGASQKVFFVLSSSCNFFALCIISRTMEKMHFSSSKFGFLTNFVPKVSPRILKDPEFWPIKDNWQNIIQFGRRMAHEKHVPSEPTLYPTKNGSNQMKTFYNRQKLGNTQTNILLFLSSLSLCNPKIFCQSHLHNSEHLPMRSSEVLKLWSFHVNEKQKFWSLHVINTILQLWLRTKNEHLLARRNSGRRFLGCSLWPVRNICL